MHQTVCTPDNMKHVSSALLGVSPVIMQEHSKTSATYLNNTWTFIHIKTSSCSAVLPTIFWYSEAPMHNEMHNAENCIFTYHVPSSIQIFHYLPPSLWIFIQVSQNVWTQIKLMSKNVTVPSFTIWKFSLIFTAF